MKVVMKMLRQIRRGCGTLPHLGPHPGTWILVALVAMGAIAGTWLGAGIMLLLFGPIYLAGAYSRAKDSDCIERSGARG